MTEFRRLYPFPGALQLICGDCGALIYPDLRELHEKQHRSPPNLWRKPVPEGKP